MLYFSDCFTSPEMFLNCELRNVPNGGSVTQGSPEDTDPARGRLEYLFSWDPPVTGWFQRVWCQSQWHLRQKSHEYSELTYLKCPSNYVGLHYWKMLIGPHVSRPRENPNCDMIYQGMFLISVISPQSACKAYPFICKFNMYKFNCIKTHSCIY